MRKDPIGKASRACQTRVVVVYFYYVNGASFGISHGINRTQGSGHESFSGFPVVCDSVVSRSYEPLTSDSL